MKLTNNFKGWPHCHLRGRRGHEVPTFRKPLKSFVSECCTFEKLWKPSFWWLSFKKPSKTFVPKFWLKKVWKPSTVLKSLWKSYIQLGNCANFWKWCWISNCVHGFNQKLHVLGWQFQKKTRFRYTSVLKLKNIHLNGAKTISSKTKFLKTWEKHFYKEHQNLCKNIVLKVGISKILWKALKRRLQNLLNFKNLRFQCWDS